MARTRGTDVGGLPSRSRKLPPIPTTLFTYRARCFTAEASDLKGYVWNAYITLINPKTKGKVAFDLVEVKCDREGDVKYWRFVSSNEAHGVLTIMILND